MICCGQEEDLLDTHTHKGEDGLTYYNWFALLAVAPDRALTCQLYSDAPALQCSPGSTAHLAVQQCAIVEHHGYSQSCEGVGLYQLSLGMR